MPTASRAYLELEQVRSITAAVAPYFVSLISSAALSSIEFAEIRQEVYDAIAAHQPLTDLICLEAGLDNPKDVVSVIGMTLVVHGYEQLFGAILEELSIFSAPLRGETLQ